MSQPSRESRSDRFRLASLAAASALLLTGAFGCAGQEQSNNEVSLEREASLTKERDELKALVDSIGVGREQKEAK